jgi:hypothetical protein
MTTALYLPATYYHAAIFFTGAAVPRGAAMTFAGKDELGTNDPLAIANTIVSAYGTNVDPVMNTLITLAGCRVKMGPMSDGPFAEVSASNAGAVAASAASPQVTFLIRKLTAIGGKHGSGRMFQPGVAENDVDEKGTVLAAKLTALTTAWAGFASGLDTGNAKMHLAHQYGTYVNKKGVTVLIPARVPDAVTGVVVDSVVATQRRRLRG